MTGTTYSVQFDSLNSGGNNSVSSNYMTEDTVGEMATGISSSTNYVMLAGYQQMNVSFISITAPADGTLPSINGLTGGSGVTTIEWTVLTDNFAGYALSVKATSSPALQATTGGAFFADYTLKGASPDYTFAIANTTSEFGFSPEGTDIVARYKDNGASCNTGASDTVNKCWDPFTTTNTTIAQSTGSNHPSGTATTLRLQAESGTAHIQDSGTYQATLIVTAVTL